MKKFAFTSLIAVLGCSALVIVARGQDKSKETEPVRRACAAYVEAFNRHDAKALAALWSETGEYMNQETGEKSRGRAAIEKQFGEIFKDADKLKLEVTIDSVRLVTADVAMEEGSARVDRGAGPAEESTYVAMYVKKDGQWLLDSVRETDLPGPPSHYDELKELEWLVGTWSDQSEEAEVETTFKWTKNHNFLLMTFTASINGKLDMEGTQLIGWDPARRQIRSWMFDSDGGFAEGVWTQQDNRWTVNSASTLPDGRRGSSVNMYTKQDDNTFTWESSGREVDGDVLPNIDPIKIGRKPDAKTSASAN